MQLVYRTTSHAFVEKVRVNFDAEGIGHYISLAPEGLGIGDASALGHSVFVLHAHDVPRARQVLAELGAFDRPDRPAPGTRGGKRAPMPRWLPFALAFAVALLFGALARF